MASLLGCAVAALVLFTAAAQHQCRRRITGLMPSATIASRTGPLQILGRLIGRVPIAKRYAKDAEHEANLVLALLAGIGTLAVSHILSLLVVVVILVRPWWMARRVATVRRRRIAQELPIAADLLHLCVSSGMNITKAIEHVATHLSGPMGTEFTLVQGDVRRGRRLADALDDAGARLGDEAQSMVGVLVSSERYGAPLSAVLERIASEARRNQERRAEQAARRLSVQLLFPVAGTILPAFALLTVAPLLASSFGPLASLFH